MRFHGWSGGALTALLTLGTALAGQVGLSTPQASLRSGHGAAPAAGPAPSADPAAPSRHPAREAEAPAPCRSAHELTAQGSATQEPTPQAPAVSIEPVTLEGEIQALRVAVDGAPFTTLHLDGRIPYLHPVLGPTGAPMTRGFPMEPGPLDARDHPHHQSLWVAHGDVAGLDFWHDPQCAIRLAGAPVVEGGRVTVPLEWVGPGERVVLRESRRLEFGAEEGRRWIDQRCEFLATEEGVTFGDTKEGSFAVRLRPELRVDGEHAVGTLRSSEGREGKATWGKPARWMHCEGVVGEERLSLTLFDHPTNPRHPTRWHSRTYGLVAANPFGLHHFTGSPKGEGALAVGAKEPVTFRHRFVLRSSPAPTPGPDAATLDAEAKAFAEGS